LEDQITIGVSGEVPHKQTGATGAGFCTIGQDAWPSKATAKKTLQQNLTCSFT